MDSENLELILFPVLKLTILVLNVAVQIMYRVEWLVETLYLDLELGYKLQSCFFTSSSFDAAHASRALKDFPQSHLIDLNLVFILQILSLAT